MFSLHKQVIIISFIYAFLIMFGVYGFGTDYYGGYGFGSEHYGTSGYVAASEHYGTIRFNNQDLGWFITTIHYKEIAIGLGFVSLLLAYSTGVLLLTESQLTKYKFPKYSYILLLHCWPILMFATNVVRQGLVTALVYFSIILYTYNFKKLSVGLILCTLFFHKIALLFAPILLFSIIIIEVYKMLPINKVIFHLLNSLITILILLLIYIFLIYNTIGYKAIDSRAIGGDFTSIFLLINILYISYFLIKGITLELIPLFLFYASIIFIPLSFIGYSWEYERLNMSIIILYIICLSRDVVFFNVRNFLIFISALCLFLISYYQGIFESLN
jgi:hypothetical protein